MIPVVTTSEMRAADAAASDPVEVLIERAGAAVARRALAILGGSYGRRVIVIAGKGNNGADGRAAAAVLERRGVRVLVVDAVSAPEVLPECDLVIDAAYGTSFRGDYTAPHPGGAPVLSVDLPSGLDGDTGEAGAEVVRADATVTFAALKPGLLLGRGPDLAGAVSVADIGLDVGEPSAHLIEDADARLAMPPRRRDDHKWKSAVIVIGGSAGLVGAPWLAARTALRVGAGNVRMAVPGATGWEAPPSEVYSRLLPQEGWAAQALEDGKKCRAVVLGPGLGLGESAASDVVKFLEAATQPVVVDADALTLLGVKAGEVLRRRKAPTVLTPHEAEFERMAGHAPGPKRLDDVRALAADTGAVVLLKGPTTIIGAPDGAVLMSASGSARLATAGAGDVLAGAIAAFLARGAEPLLAAAAAAHAHGAAARLAEPGFVAGDLIDLVPEWLAT